MELAIQLVFTYKEGPHGELAIQLVAVYKMGDAGAVKRKTCMKT